MPKAVEKEPKIPTLSKLAHIHSRISKGFAPYTAIDEEKELEGMEEHRLDLVALAADDSEVVSTALKTGISVKDENKTGIKKLDQRFNLERFSVVELIKIFKNDLTKYELPFFLHSDDRSSKNRANLTQNQRTITAKIVQNQRNISAKLLQN